MKIEEIPVWEAFVAVARYGGFSSASQALGVAIPQLSKRVAKLEADLGVRMFQRTTRSVALTEEGRSLLPRVVAALDDFSSIEASLESRQDLSGTLRLTSIPFVAHRLLLPVFSEFMALHPKVKIELDLSEHVMNLIEANIDLAIRIQEPSDSQLVYRQLASNDLVLCASPRYLKENMKPLSEPKHLRDHHVLMMDIHGAVRFQSGQGKLSDFVGESRLRCNNGWYLSELAKNHFGVLVRSIWDVRPLMDSGELVQVLKKHPLHNFGHIYAVIPSRRYLAPRVRVFLDFLLAKSASWSV